MWDVLKGLIMKMTLKDDLTHEDTGGTCFCPSPGVSLGHGQMKEADWILSSLEGFSASR